MLEVVIMMFKDWIPQRVLCAVATVALLSAGMVCAAGESSADTTPDTTYVHEHAALRKSMPLVKSRRVDNLNHIYMFDDEPLDGRTPVILLPGRAEEFQRSSWWKKLRKMTKKDKAFQKHYKLYCFIYDSTEELNEQSDDYVRELKAYFGDLPEQGRQVVAVTYSLGGMILRESMMDRDVYDLTHTVFAVAVPFHGSPLFDPDWFTKYLRPPNHSPVRRLWDRVVYEAYMMGKGNLKRGLSWTNFDGSKPMYQEAELNGDMLVSNLDVYQEHPATFLLKKKTIIYTSYLKNEHTNAKDLNIKTLLGKPLYVPKAVAGSVLPVYGKSVHSVFTYMNRQLAELPTYDPEHPKGVEHHLYRYNDGVFPISSMLYLPPRDRPYNEDFETLCTFIDVQKARIFVDIDHMHIGEYSLRKKRIRVEDVLHPEDGERTPNQWLIYDLQQLAPELKQVWANEDSSQ